MPAPGHLLRPVVRALHQKRHENGLDPGLVGAQVNLGNLLVRKGLYAEAAARYRAALRVDPDDKIARENLAAITALLASPRRTR